VSPTTRPPRAASATRGAAILLAGTLLLAACGGGDDAAGWAEPDVAVQTMPAPLPMVPEARSGAAGAPATGGGLVGGGVTGDAVADPTGRAVVRNAFLDLVVDDGAAAIDAAIGIAAAAGGYVAGTYLSRGEDGTVSGTLTLRVPADRLDEVVEQLDDLARAVPTRSVDEYDVSDQLRDLDAQLENLRAYETELRALLTEVRQRSGSAEDLLAVSDRLRQVRTEIDMYEGLRRQLTQQVALSTVTVSITPARAATPVAGAWDLPGVVRDALAALVTVGRWLVEAGIWVVVVGLPALVGLWVVRRAWRGWRSRRRAG
jgi:hypothetical protein